MFGVKLAFTSLTSHPVNPFISDVYYVTILHRCFLPLGERREGV